MVEIEEPGGIGVVADTSPELLPDNAWTDANNVTFANGSARSSYGYQQVYNPPSIAPYHVLPVTISGSRYWIYVGTASVYCVNGSTHTNLSPAGAYSGSANSWTSCVLGGIPIINSGSTSDYPQSWDLNTANNFGNLANWQANYYCKVIRAYKNYLVALNITKTTTNYPYMVKWSHPADPGAVPASWDQTSASYDAGEFDLSEGQDIIIDGLQLRNSFMIYKENSIWRMDYVGGSYVMGFTKVLGQGALARNCIVEIDGVHCVLTGDDLIIHDGNSPTSVLDGKDRQALFANMDSASYKNSFLFKNPYANEVWVCYPTPGASVPNKALIWNWRNKTVTYRTLPGIAHANTGLVESGLSGTWASDSESWDSDITVWNQVDSYPDAVRVIFAGTSDTKLYLNDSTSSFNGTSITSYVERRGFDFGMPGRIKTVRGVRPRIYGPEGKTVLVSIGYTDSPYDAPTYTETTFTIGDTVSCDCMVSGRYIAIKFASGTASQWRLDSFGVDVVDSGAW